VVRGGVFYPFLGTLELTAEFGYTTEKSLSDAFPLRKTEGLGIAKILELVKAQNLL
jgi:hypothetical protein